jgi:hypothetical protein
MASRTKEQPKAKATNGRKATEPMPDLDKAPSSPASASADTTRLTGKQAAFVDAYLGQAHGNATEAARLAGYANPDPRGPENVGKSRIRNEIARRTAARALDADRTLAELAACATADLDAFTSYDGEGRPYIDWRRAQELGVTNLARRLTIRPDGTTQVELVDRLEALKTIAKHLGLLKDRLEIESKPDPAALQREILEKLGTGKN